jgi:hypothetical protein
MNGSEKWWALIHTRLLLNLPVEVSSNKTEFGYGIADTTPISEVKYTWLTGYKGNISLPEGEIRFSPVTSSTNESYSEQASGTKLTTKGVSAEEQASKKLPGFEALFSAVGLLMAGYLRRKKSW